MLLLLAKWIKCRPPNVCACPHTAFATWLWNIYLRAPLGSLEVTKKWKSLSKDSLIIFMIPSALLGVCKTFVLLCSPLLQNFVRCFYKDILSVKHETCCKTPTLLQSRETCLDDVHLLVFCITYSCAFVSVSLSLCLYFCYLFYRMYTAVLRDLR